MRAPAVDGTGGHGCYPATNTSPAPEHRAAAISPGGSRPVTMMAPAVDGTGGHGCYPATNTSPAPEHRAAAISPAGCAPTSPGQDQPLADLDAWADVDTGLQHVHVKGEDDPLRHLGDEDLLDGDWAAARPADTEYDVTEIAEARKRRSQHAPPWRSSRRKARLPVPATEAPTCSAATPTRRRARRQAGRQAGRAARHAWRRPGTPAACARRSTAAVLLWQIRASASNVLLESARSSAPTS